MTVIRIMKAPRFEMSHALPATFGRRKQMAGPKEENIEKKLEDTGAPKLASELSDADFEKVAGGGHDAPETLTPISAIYGCK